LTVTEIGATFNGSFVIVSTTGTVTGAFAATALPVHYSVVYNANSVVLTKFNPLPVALIDFQAFEREGTAQLLWRTASETNNRGFHIERSADGRRWETFGFVAGNGTTQTEHLYTFADRKPIRGLNYYRLRQEDLDGRTEYSDIRSVKMGNVGNGNLSVFPNPAAAGTELKIVFGDKTEGKEAVLYDVSGKQLFRQKMNNGLLSLPSGIEPGVYLVKVVAETGEWPVRLLVN
jgi:hypothetical protein